jgi:S1-C subfamily serine protease
MQHAAIIRREWRRLLRNSVPVRRSRALRLASAALVLLVLLSAPASRAHAAAPAGPQRPPGYLGIEFHDLTNEQAAALHLRDKRGVEVLLVDHDGPAASAGLKPHDLITGFNGHIVASGEALRRMIHDAGAGIEVRLAVFRNGNPITIHTKLANREDVERKAWARVTQGPPPPPQGAVIEGLSGIYVTGPAPSPPVATPRAAAPHQQGFIENILHGPFTGLVVEAMQPQLAGYFGAPKDEGLLVQSVESGSPAAAVGIHAGDVILRVDGQPMHSTSDWSKHLHASKGRPMNLDLLRAHQAVNLTLQPDSKKH